MSNKNEITVTLPLDLAERMNRNHTPGEIADLIEKAVAAHHNEELLGPMMKNHSTARYVYASPTGGPGPRADVHGHPNTGWIHEHEHTGPHNHWNGEQKKNLANADA